MSVWLPDDVSRCRQRMHYCSRSSICARALADIVTGSPVADFSRDIAWDQSCPHFEPVRRRPEEAPQPKEVKPWPVE